MRVAHDHLHAYAPGAYDALAPFYESYWGPAFLDDALSMFDRFLASRLPAGSHVLDLCCGAGQFAAWLVRSGRRVTGVDASSSMLDYAQKKAPHSQFYVADMRSFRLPSVFDAAVCFYNSINQVLTLEGLRATLRSVGRHLQPGGWFLFDIVLEEGYAQSRNAEEAVVCGVRSCDLACSYNERKRLASCRVTVRDLAARSQVGSWEFFQRPFPVPLLITELHQLGFLFVHVDRVTSVSPPGARVAITARRSPDLEYQPTAMPSEAARIHRQENRLCLIHAH